MLSKVQQKSRTPTIVRDNFKNKEKKSHTKRKRTNFDCQIILKEEK
jgi:hypothetical protein